MLVIIITLALVALSALAYIVLTRDTQAPVHPITVTPASHAPVWLPQEGVTLDAQDPTKGLHGEYLWNEDMYTR